MTKIKTNTGEMIHYDKAPIYMKINSHYGYIIIHHDNIILFFYKDTTNNTITYDILDWEIIQQ